VVYVIGAGPSAGGFHVYSRAGGKWKEESIAGLRIAAGPAGKVYVVQDAASSNAIMASMTITPGPTTITLSGSTSIPVSPNIQVAPPSGGTTNSTSGSLVVGTPTQP